MSHQTNLHAIVKLVTVVLLVAVFSVAPPAQQASTQQTPAPQTPVKPEQKPATPAQDPPSDPDTVVRISTTLVQVDAVVTNNKGEHVEDLREEDFELLVDGKKQELTYFTLVKLPEPKPAGKTDKADKTTKAALPATNMPTQAIAPEQVKRTLAFVVDDLGLSFESIYFARRALKKFVDEQMQDGDLVGIIRTGRGAGIFQQFTSDKRILYAAIEKLSWNPYSRDMMPRFPNNDPNDIRSEESREAEARAEEFREAAFSVGTLGALNFVVRGLRELPGRKMAILVSDGFRLFNRNGDNRQVLDNLQRLVDLANRSSVVIYSIDAKGLQTLLPDASTSGVPRPEDFQRVSQNNFDSQEGLTYVARETGGIAFLNNNDLNVGIQKALKDGQSYYLLGFDPADEKFDRKYHTIKVRVKRPGAQVRTRAGFLGIPDRPRREDLASVGGVETRNRQIVGALFSPFGARELPLQMTSFFFTTNNPKRGQKNEPDMLSFVRSLYHVDPARLTLTDNPQVAGEKQVTLEIASFTFNEAGVIIDQHGRSFTLRFDDTRLKLALAKGLLLDEDFVLRKPGAYQFRTVIRDAATGRLGSAGQFIQIPDLSKKRLALSGLVLAAAKDIPPATNTTTESPEINASPAVRRFARDSAFDYGAVIYNAAANPATGQPALTMQIEIYRDGKAIYQAQPRPVEVAGVGNGGRLECGGRLKLTGLPPGDYLLHLIVTDTVAKQKYARADQWMDFGIR